MNRRGVTHADVEAALITPAVVESTPHRGVPRWRYHRGALCVVISQDGSTVITILLRSLEAWTDDDARLGINGRDGQAFTPYATSITAGSRVHSLVSGHAGTVRRVEGDDVRVRWDEPVAPGIRATWTAAHRLAVER